MPGKLNCKQSLRAFLFLILPNFILHFLLLFCSTGDHACSSNQGNIGYKSCYGLRSCYNNKGGVIGKMIMSKDDITGSEPGASCVGTNPTNISPKDYLGICQDNVAKEIGESSCTDGELVCYSITRNPISIGDK